MKESGGSPPRRGRRWRRGRRGRLGAYRRLSCGRRFRCRSSRARSRPESRGTWLVEYIEVI